MRKCAAGCLAVAVIMGSVTGCGSKTAPAETTVATTAAVSTEATTEVVETTVSGTPPMTDIVEAATAAPEGVVYAESAEDWSPDLMNPDMREFVKRIHEYDVVGQGSGASDIWLTAQATDSGEDTDITLADCAITAAILQLLQMSDEIELGKAGKLQWNSSNELANLFGFADAGSMQDAGLGSMDFVPEGVLETFDTSDFAPEFSSVFDRYYFKEEGDVEAFYDKNDIKVFRNEDHALLDIVGSTVVPLKWEDGNYYVAVFGTSGYMLFGDLSVTAMKVSESGDDDGTWTSKTINVRADWEKLMTEASKLGYLVSDSSDLFIRDDIPVVIISEQYLLGLDSSDALDSMFAEFVKAEDWTEGITVADESISEFDETEAEAFFIEYLGLTEEDFE